MSKPVEINIGRQDVVWNYLATFLQIGSGVLLFPIILRMLPSETVGIWAIFISITAMVNMLDFGFSPSFTRNVTYIFSGVNKLEKTGISEQKIELGINFQLLSDIILSMKWFYKRIALAALLSLSVLGSLYLFYILNTNYNSDKVEVWISWAIFCFVNTYNIYTLYYDSLMLGSGKVMRNKQIIIVSQIGYLTTALALILSGAGIVGIVAAQFVSLIIKRFLSYKSFFTPQLRNELPLAEVKSVKEIIRVIMPNSIKIGITSIGSFLGYESVIIVGSLYLPLEQLASYGISIQIIGVIASLGMVYYSSYMPKVAFLRVQKDLLKIRKIYWISVFILLSVFVVSGAILVFAGNEILVLLKSNTFLLSGSMLLGLLTINLLEKNHAMAGGFLLTNNEVPYYKAAIISGIVTVILLFLFVKVLNWGIWGMILAPGISQLAYQNWKWPLHLMQQLKQ